MVRFQISFFRESIILSFLAQTLTFWKSESIFDSSSTDACLEWDFGLRESGRRNWANDFISSREKCDQI